MKVRSTAHRLGYRFRLHAKRLPGTPDLVFPRLRKVILVHGCWWHRHSCPLGEKSPRSNLEYWGPKLRRNVERDQEAHRALSQLGWQILVIWECETADANRLAAKLQAFLGGLRAGERATKGSRRGA
jgi:DNA mismatch endonuclease (patch repair protein)